MDSEEMRIDQVDELPTRGVRSSKFDGLLDTFEEHGMNVAVVRTNGSVSSAKVSLQGRIKARGLNLETHIRGGKLYVTRKAV